MTVLYGRNGAGKTTLLNALRSALTGLAGELPVELHLQLPGTVSGHVMLPSEQIGGTHEGRAVVPCLPSPRRIEGSDEEWSEQAILDAAEDFMQRWMPFGDPSMVADALITRRLALVPVGTERPRWQIWLAADMSHPAMAPWSDGIRDLLVEYQAVDREYHRRDAEDLDNEAQHRRRIEIVQALSQHPIFASNWLLNTDPQGQDGDRYSLTEALIGTWIATGIPTAPADGLPVLVSMIGETSSLRWPRTLFEVDDTTLQHVLVDAVRHGVKTGDDLRALANELTARADDTYQGLLMDAPDLQVSVADEQLWPYKPALTWRAKKWRTLHELSAGEGRWARISAMLTTAPLCPWPLSAYDGEDHRDLHPVESTAPRILLLDEPEAHLHRAAEAHMTSGLMQTAEVGLDYLVVATHSPELLNAPDSHVIWVDEGQAKPLDGADMSNLAALGLRPSDLLAITRVILLVEGHHDELILGAVIGDQLRRANTLIIPMDGGKNLASAIDSVVLFRKTRAHVVGLLDNMAPEHVTRTWEAALVARAGFGVAKAHRLLKDELPGDKSENKYLRDWLTQAIAQEGEFPLERMTPYGLEARDILDYLPLSFFSKTARSWEKLHEQHDEYSEEVKRKGRGKPKDFKAWFAGQYNVDFSDANILQALELLDDVPPEFQAIADLCMRVGRSVA